MAITLSSVTQAAIPATKHSVGGDTFTITAGKSLKVETSPRGEDILDVEVPEGKTWVVTIDVGIVETG